MAPENNVVRRISPITAKFPAPEFSSPQNKSRRRSGSEALENVALRVFSRRANPAAPVEEVSLPENKKKRISASEASNDLVLSVSSSRPKSKAATTSFLSPENNKTGKSASEASVLTMSEQRCVRKSPRLSVNQVICNGGLIKCKTFAEKQPNKKKNTTPSSSKKKKKEELEVSFLIGEPVPEDEARRAWPYRYHDQVQAANGLSSKQDDDDEDVLVLNVKCHYYRAEVLKCVFDLGDCAFVKGKEGEPNYVGRIVEFFKTMDDEDYFRVQWFYRAEDTVMNKEAFAHDKRRLFVSDLMNDNPLDCIVSKVKVMHIQPSVKLKSKPFPACDFYYDMKYSVDYSTFSTINDYSNLSLSDTMKTIQINENKPRCGMLSSPKPTKSEMALLDVYSGCGGMSTGLCLGAKLTGLSLVTRWALDVNKSACESLKLNHPETQIRNESAEDFLNLLKEWEKLCKRYAIDHVGRATNSCSGVLRGAPRDTNLRTKYKITSDEYEVASIIDICYGDPCDTGKHGVYFLVRWAGYGPSEDTWEPIEGLSNCQERIQNFVKKGSREKILPRPGDVDIICGGPPCQGISGYNRHRNIESPLDDERNRQIVVFMDIISFLKPKFALMENVVDILRFAKGSLGRYALSRLVNLNYQARLGIMAAGCYGLPQFRLRVFLWGAHPNESLPQFPLPTHDVVLRYGAPIEFERNVVAYDEEKLPDLEKALVLQDAISDLPPVSNHEACDKMAYKGFPKTDFQKHIRATQSETMGVPSDTTQREGAVLYDHCPLPLGEDDYLRVCRIPQRKGANFRDLPGVVVGDNNVVRRDPATEITLPSGRKLVPDYAINFCDGKSLRPFARLWWDETVPTVLTRPDPHNQAILHPEQDRVLTVREVARLQGFPDYYRFCGDVKERYCQLGNAVAIPVGRALGYVLGMAVQKLTGDSPLMTLPPKFSHTTTIELLQSSSWNGTK